MTEKEMVRISKFLSKHLRHTPHEIGTTLDDGGWIDVAELIAACDRAGVRIERDELEEVVRRNDKQRFSFNDDGSRIRANQGHSVDVDLQLEAIAPPAMLFHGTPQKFAGSILNHGLRKMNRHHVHLSADIATAHKVGARRGKPVVFAVDAGAMHAAGFEFYRSSNGVWLVDSVPVAYLRTVAEI